MTPAARPDSSGEAPWIRIGACAVTIQISARPGASRQGIVRAGPDGLVIAVHSAPDKGKANDELIALLAKMLAVPRSSITLIRGATSRRKTIRIATPQPAIVARACEALSIRKREC